MIYQCLLYLTDNLQSHVRWRPNPLLLRRLIPGILFLPNPIPGSHIFRSLFLRRLILRSWSSNCTIVFKGIAGIILPAAGNVTTFFQIYVVTFAFLVIVGVYKASILNIVVVNEIVLSLPVPLCKVLSSPYFLSKGSVYL